MRDLGLAFLIPHAIAWSDEKRVFPADEFSYRFDTVVIE